ncbi:MAG TPA: alpha/beta fold hydrolase [Draconibacterium sp.]|nr:alpha/beta fold hydrolase [Draconibacterium sp.]
MKKTNLLFFVIVFSLGYILFVNKNTNAQETSDPPLKISFMHDNHRLQGWFYKAEGNGPFPTLILLHGAMGRDGDIFNLGQSLSREGYNVLTYSYPGSWRSEGLKTDRAALESVASAIGFIRSKTTIQEFDIDTTDIILAGHSYGGGMALLGAALDPGIHKVIGIASADLYETANELEQSQERQQNFQQMVDRMLMNPSMARGTTGKEYVDKMISDKERYNTVKYAGVLAEKHILLLTGWLDRMKPIERYALPLYRALQAQGSQNVTIMAFNTNHEFYSAQNEMTKTIIEWLNKME